MTIAGEDGPRKEELNVDPDVISSSETDKRPMKPSEVDNAQPLVRNYR
jgi:hypothetical protein